MGKMNNNGLRLLGLCTENWLTISNSLFHMKTKYKTSWSKQWHLIDYVMSQKLYI